MGTLLILLLVAALASGQEATFRAGVALVKVDIEVTEHDRVVSDLTKDDFTILDDGEPREVVYFGRETEPLWVLLLLDVSGSMRKHVEDMAAASRTALGALRPGDHAGVMLFSRNTTVHRPFTGDFGDVAGGIASAVQRRDLGSGTRINDSILAAADHLRQEAESRPGRRAIVILTDNQGMNYECPDEKVLAALWGADAVLNPIVTGDAKPPKPVPAGRVTNPDFTPSNVFHLARETGGVAVRSNKAGRAFAEVMERLRTRYSLHYRAPESDPGVFRPIRVKLSEAARRRHPNAQLHARSGYYVP